MTDAALRDLAARAATGDDAARERLTAPARAQARDILAEDRFHVAKSDDGGPLHGVFSWIGDRLSDLAGTAPGGELLGWLVLAAVALAAAAALATWAGARRRRAAPAAHRRPLGLDAASAASPADLERRALAAERDGDLDAAVRLRFAAGLLRLDALRVIDLRPSLTSGDVGRTVRSSRYDDLATTHDAIAYGGRHATATDATAAREAWPAVLQEARR